MITARQLRQARRLYKRLYASYGLKWSEAKEVLQNASQYAKLCKIWGV